MNTKNWLQLIIVKLCIAMNVMKIPRVKYNNIVQFENTMFYFGFVLIGYRLMEIG